MFHDFVWNEIIFFRRDAGAVERGSLENCCTFRGTEGSNPSLSAGNESKKKQNPEIVSFSGFCLFTPTQLKAKFC